MYLIHEKVSIFFRFFVNYEKAAHLYFGCFLFPYQLKDHSQCTLL